MPDPLPPLPPGIRELRLASPRMVGEDVRAWQLFLRGEGLDLAADGSFGERTSDRTLFFQRAYAIPQTGVVDGATLLAASTGPRPFRPLPAGAPPSGLGRARGIDASRHQGRVPWKAVRAAGGLFAFNKATEGLSWKDPLFLENTLGTRDAGLYSGAYHYFQAQQDAAKQAESFHATAGGSVDMPPVIDFESLAGVPAGRAVESARAFVEVTEALWGQEAILYTYTNFWEALLAVGAVDVETLAFFAARDLWLADYRAQPKTPITWARWRFLQFDGDGGFVLPNGVDADFNVFDGDEGELAEWVELRRAA